jgi:type IV pilus assembly protein PilW
MRFKPTSNKKGVTLIELLVALVICGLVVAGIYRVFVAQSKAYTVQDQVVEVQQNIRSAMELLLRDLRMAGFDDDNLNSTVTIANPVVYPVAVDSITVNYEHYNTTTLIYERYAVAYWRDAANSTLLRQLTINDVAGPQEILLSNVDELNFRYGLDANDDGVIDDQNADGIIDNNDWVTAAGVGTTKVVALRVLLKARPDQTNQDVQKMVSPRTLESKVTLRNQCLIRFN